MKSEILDKKSIDKTITLFYLYRFISRLSFYVPILIIFFLHLKLGLIDIAMLVVIYGLMTTLVSAPPISKITLKLAPKNRLIIGELLKASSVGLMFFSNLLVNSRVFDLYSVLIIAQLLGGIGYSLSAGSDGSFLFTYCKSKRLDDEYQEHESKSASIMFLSFLGAGVIGGILSVYDIRLPFLFTMVAHISCVLIIINFESIIYTNSDSNNKGQLLTEFRNLKLLNNVLFYSVSRAFVMTLGVSILPIYFFNDLHISIGLFGVIFGTYTLIGYFSGRNAVKLRNRFGENQLSIFLVFCVLLSLFLLYTVHSIVAVVAPIFLYVMAGAIRPYSMTRINTEIKYDKNRNTVIGFAESAFGLINVIMVLASFYYLDKLENIYEVFYSLILFAIFLYGVLYILGRVSEMKIRNQLKKEVEIK